MSAEREAVFFVVSRAPTILPANLISHESSPHRWSGIVVVDWWSGVLLLPFSEAPLSLLGALAPARISFGNVGHLDICAWSSLFKFSILRGQCLDTRSYHS